GERPAAASRTQARTGQPSQGGPGPQQALQEAGAAVTPPPASGPRRGRRRVPLATLPQRFGTAQQPVDSRDLLFGGGATGGPDVHYVVALTGIFSIRMALALNSAVPDLGSVASMVRTLVATWSGKWSVMNASPGRSDGSNRTSTSTDPRREFA